MDQKLVNSAKILDIIVRNKAPKYNIIFRKNSMLWRSFIYLFTYWRLQGEICVALTWTRNLHSEIKLKSFVIIQISAIKGEKTSTMTYVMTRY